MSTLIIAEKPDQARAYMDGLGIAHGAKDHLARGKTFLDSNTTIVGARGHLIELSEPETYGEQYKDRRDLSILPILPSNFKYDIPKENSFLFSEIRNEIQKTDKIIVATDKDNEGAAIAFNIIRFSNGFQKKIMRAYPSSLDKKAVVKCFKNLEPIDQSWRNASAAIARSRSDWLIGMNLSRLYTTKLYHEGINGNYAVGRALSATLALICKWNDSIDNFKEQPIFTLKATGIIGNQKAEFSSDIKVTGSDEQPNAKQEYIKILKQKKLASKQIVAQITDIKTDIKEQYPPVLLTKGSLYKAMDKTYGWSQKKSKEIMQQNYEQGYQTYPRTDSGLITKDQYEYLGKLMPDYLKAINCADAFEPFRIPENKVKQYLLKDDTGAAHQGIIPSEKIMDESADVTDDQRKMYDVVVRHSLTVWQKPYKYLSNSITAEKNQTKFTAKNTGLIDNGWKAILPPAQKKKSKAKTSKEEKVEPALEYQKFCKKGDTLDLALHTDVSKTKPLPLLKEIQIYDGGGLMENAYKYVDNPESAKILKKVKGIGTSATRDTILESLLQKEYIEVDSKDQIHVTSNGSLMNWLLRNSLISSPNLTAKWEEQYEEIAQGKVKADKLINATAKLIIKEIEQANTSWDSKAIQDYYKKKYLEVSEKNKIGVCPQCNNPVIYTSFYYKDKKYNVYKCANKECNFIIYEKYWNKKISETNMIKLLTQGHTGKINGVVFPKSKKPCAVVLSLRYDDKKQCETLAVEKIL